MRGAEPFELAGADAGVLLLHGFSGSVYEVRELGRRLHEAGYGVIAPALAGHGTTPDDLARISRDDLVAGASQAYRDAARRYSRVYAVGLSLGGALALHVAARHPLAGLVTISAPVHMSRLVAWGAPLAAHLAPRRHVISNYAAWRGEVIGYRSTPLSSLQTFLEVLAVVRRDLPRVRAPLLVLHSTGDRTVPLSNAPYILAHVASADKAMRIYRGGRHLLTLPPHLDRIVADVVRFLHAREAPFGADRGSGAKGAPPQANEPGGLC